MPAKMKRPVAIAALALMIPMLDPSALVHPYSPAGLVRAPGISRSGS
jgi:hypothetical protein